MTIRAPRGFKFKIEPSRTLEKEIEISLIKIRTNKIVGNVRLQWIYFYSHRDFNPRSRAFQQKRFETHSFVEEEYRGKGYGTLLYLKAIYVGLKHGLKISSSRNTSDDAVQVWKSKTLRKHFQIQKRGDRYYVIR